MSDIEKKKLGMFSPINTREVALEMIKGASCAFYFIAAFEAVIGIWSLKGATADSGITMLFDSLGYAVLAFFLNRFNSRVAATILLLSTSVSAIVTLLNKIGVLHYLRVRSSPSYPVTQLCPMHCLS